MSGGETPHGTGVKPRSQYDHGWARRRDSMGGSRGNNPFFIERGQIPYRASLVKQPLLDARLLLVMVGRSFAAM